MSDDDDDVSYAFDETQAMVMVAFQQNKLRIEDDKTLFKIDHIVCLDNGTVIMTKGEKERC